MKKLLIILLSVVSLSAFAQQKNVAVLTPICRDNSVNNFYQQIVRGALESAVTATDEYVAFDRTAFDKVLEEHKFEQSGAVDDAQIRRMGVYAGVDYVLITEVSAYDGYMSVLVKILNIETGESSKGLSELMEQTPPIVQESCKELARKVFGIVDFASGTRKGILSLPEGRYEGEIKNGKPQGKGKMYYNSDNEDERVSFDGEWENGVPSGKGTMVWRRGLVVVGSWIDGKRSGEAKATLPTKDSIEGAYMNDEWNGPITIFFCNGNKYEGIAKDNELMRGSGTLYLKDGSKYVGEFVWDKEASYGYYNGFGILYLPDGKGRYEGQWENGKKNGKGTMFFPEGKIVGTFVNDVMSGYFELFYSDGSKEYGKCVNGKQDGQWTRRTASGKYLTGWYTNGVMTTKYH